MIDSDKLQALIVEALDDGKGKDIKVIDVRNFTDIADFMVLATGTSDRHCKSLADRAVDKSREVGIKPIGVEGTEGGEWILVDLQDVIVHVMQPRTRDFYNLEKLWDMTTQRRGQAR
ncbi:MAG: ribosome silencing factor [Gammaproteobacteria bacterium]|nr:ribosome silencing factor [Gammaproteobacteria bacterium]